MRPAIEMNDAADIQSAATAAPFATAGMFCSATKKPLVSLTRLRQAMPMYRANDAATKTSAQVWMSLMTGSRRRCAR